MGRKKKAVAHPPPPGWVITLEARANGRILTPGTELSITGERGRFRFQRHVTTPKGEWIDVVGGAKGIERMRAFHPDRVKRVHRINKTRANLT